ncbi:MAG TPA: MerR family transcriptional regulator [Streptosporangiaceae bacterium]
MDGIQDPEQARSFTIQQVARLTGLSEYTLRYYEKIGLIDPVDRDDSSGHRRYDGDELTRVESLARLRAIGLGIEEMRVLMHSRGHSPETVDTKIALLAAHRNKLETEIRSLRARKRFTENRIAYWQAVLAGDKAAARQLTAEGDALSEHLG